MADEMFDLSDKLAWVTGSSRNLGRAMVDDLTRQGADVVVSNNTHDEERAETVADLRDRHDVEVYGVQVDIGDPGSVADAIDEIHAEAGQVDVLVNNAAIRPHRSFDDVTLEEWDQVLRVNLTGAYLCTRAVLPDMRANGWGRIINISGVDAFLGKPKRPHVVTTSAGIVGFTRSIAQEFAEYGITVNCVSPGAYRTERDPDWHPDPETRYDGLRRRIPLQRLGEPHDLSPTIAFLASEQGGYITGQVIHVNGGLFPTVRDPTEHDLDSLL